MWLYGELCSLVLEPAGREENAIGIAGVISDKIVKLVKSGRTNYI